jgi:hypothetical protein
MRNAETMLRVYEELANRFARQNEPRYRDHCLVLAADVALSASRPQDAEHLRKRLLQFNPHHLLRPFASMAEAMQAPDVQEYVADLRRQWPADYAQKLYLEGDKALAETPAPSVKLPRTEVPRQTEPGTAPAVQAKPVAAVPSARPIALLPVRATTVPVAPPVPPPPVPPPGNPLGPWLAMLLLLLGIAGGVGLFFLAFVWPLLE